MLGRGLKTTLMDIYAEISLGTECIGKVNFELKHSTLQMVETKHGSLICDTSLHVEKYGNFFVPMTFFFIFSFLK
jgi:hypothetical protein